VTALMRSTGFDRQAWALLAPMLIIMAIVTGYPLVNTVRLSFTDARLTGRQSIVKWVGLENFGYAVTDPDFAAAFLRTLHFTLLSVGAEILLGVLVALLLNREFVGRTIVRALLVLPLALPTIVNAIMWRLIYNPEFGSWNALLLRLGLIDAYRSWLGETGTAMNMVILADVWKNYPLVTLIVLAALQTIPRELYEAAAIDGANWWQKIWYVNLPMMRNIIQITALFSLIVTFANFDIVKILTNGGPVDQTHVFATWAFTLGIWGNDLPLGASVSLFMFPILAVAAVLILRNVRKRGNEA
jgi:multiple sugar transport system permease protein